MKAFLDAAEAERKILLEKVTQRNKTIHQLTHHLHSLQAMVQTQPGTQSGLSEEAMLAAEVSFEKSKMDPAPWVPTSTGDRSDRTSTNTSINSHNPSFSFCPGASYNDVAFAQHITASLQPYRGEPLVLPSRDTSPQSAMGVDGRWRGGRPGNSSTSAPSSPSLQRSYLMDSGAQNVQQMQDARDAPFSSSPLLDHRAGARGAEKRSSGDLLHQSYSQRNERQQQQEEVGDEEESWKRAGENEIGRRTYSKSPTTPSSVSYGRTIVLPWQGPSYPPLHTATHGRDVEGYREDRQGQGQVPHIGSRERERVRGEVEYSSGGHADDFERRRWIESESASARASANMTTPSVHPLMQSILATDNATPIDKNRDRDRGRERDRERDTVGNSDEGYEERRFCYRYSNGDRSSP